MVDKTNVSIKREVFRGKYYIVHRENNKLINRRKWNKEFTKKDAIVQFKSTNSLYKEVIRTRLANLTETVDYRKSQRVRGRGKFQYVVSANISGTEIIARSKLHDSDYPKSEAKEEAFTSFYERVAQSYGFEYDAKTGMELMQGFKGKINHGIVYYRG